MSLPSSPEPGTGTTVRTEPVYRFYGCGSGSLAGHVRLNLAVLAVLVGVWALTGADYFWPAWAALGMAAGLAFKALIFRRRGYRPVRVDASPPTVDRPDGD